MDTLRFGQLFQKAKRTIPKQALKLISGRAVNTHKFWNDFCEIPENWFFKDNWLLTNSPLNEVRASVQTCPSSPLFLTLRLLADTGLLVKVVITESIAVEEEDRLSHEKHRICCLSCLPHPLSCPHTRACLAPSSSTTLGGRPGFRAQRSLPPQSSPLSAVCAPVVPFLRRLSSLGTCSSY